MSWEDRAPERPDEAEKIRKLLLWIWSDDGFRDLFYQWPREVALGQVDLHLPRPGKLVVIDPEWDRHHVIDAEAGNPYYLVIPPKPPRLADRSRYRTEQAWDAAWQRATEYGYGM